MKTKMNYSAFNHLADKKRNGIFVILIAIFISLLSSCGNKDNNFITKNQEMQNYLSSYTYWELATDNTQYIEFHQATTQGYHPTYYSKLIAPNVGLNGNYYVNSYNGNINDGQYISLTSNVANSTSKLFRITSSNMATNVLELECNGLNFKLIGKH